MKILSLLIGGVLSTTLITQAAAERAPRHLTSDPRITVVAYSPNNVVPITGTPFTTTQITFGPHETIENVQNGDLGAWTLSISKTLPNMLFVKPTTTDSITNMTVVTNVHTYYFALSSKAPVATTTGQTPTAMATYAVHFTYPEAVKQAALAALKHQRSDQQAKLSPFQNPRDYDWNYTFHGDRTIMPLHVFDDGQFTYLQLRPHQSVPAVFAVTRPTGKESVVNTRMQGGYLVVETTAPQFTLRAGPQHVASLFNRTRINDYWHHQALESQQ